MLAKLLLGMAKRFFLYQVCTYLLLAKINSLSFHTLPFLPNEAIGINTPMASRLKGDWNKIINLLQVGSSTR